ncbi:hypothetical protein GCM10022217_23840 [Chryseobacterium ginsenosidimutans]|uniref:eCIS core domain-containing protein n=1 Tax=Chryseobacterium ginsenosidimutans TaxID=687846 RepID=UPI0031D67011
METANLQKEQKTSSKKKNSTFFKPAIQKKLSVGSANDSYEVEADQVADKVMKMSEPSPHITHTGALVQRKCAHCEQEENLQMKPLAETITPLIQRSSKESLGESHAPNHIESQISSHKGNGSSMDSGTKNFMENRFGTDFSSVKIHTGSEAVQMSRELNAQAFAVGNDIYFNEGKYSPNSDSGKHLLAHELTHTIQQNKLSQISAKRIQRTVNTWGGTWDTDQYDLVTPATAAGSRGVDIKLKFTPNANVNAEMIGLTQTVQGIIGGATALTPAAATRAISATDAISINTGTGETDEGTAIDRASGYNNPIYPVSNAASASLDDATVSAGWGQHGWRYTDASGTLQTQDGKLNDSPRRSNAQANARHIFETTALATRGAQSGFYYGSVRWGWRTDSAGAFSKIPLAVVSQGAPSSTFFKAAENWNPGSSSTGAGNVDLPIIDVQVTTVSITQQLSASVFGPPITLPAGTRVRYVPNIPYINPKIEVVDGPHTGITIEILPSDMANIRDER